MSMENLIKNNIAEEICICCERIIVLNGFRSTQIGPNSELYSYLNKYIQNLMFKPELSIFSPMEDNESFNGEEVDIHGQFGAEVRSLVSELHYCKI